MYHVRYLDLDIGVDCEFKQGGLVCPRKAAAEIYTKSPNGNEDNRYLCRYHLDLAKQENEERELEA